MTVIHDRSYQEPDRAYWVEKGYAMETVHSLRFSYRFTEEDRKREADMLAGKDADACERIKRDIVNARDTFMHRLMSNIAARFICYNYEPTEDDEQAFSGVFWELYFWCNHFQDIPSRRDYSYFTLTFNREHPVQWQMALCRRVVAYVEALHRDNPNLEVAIQYATWYDEPRIRQDALRIRDQVLNKRCTYHGMEGKLILNGDRVLFRKLYSRTTAYQINDATVLEIYWQLHPAERKELDAVCQS